MSFFELDNMGIIITSRKDRILAKHIEIYGKDDNDLTPMETAKCAVSIVNITYEDENGKCPVDEHSKYFANKYTGNIVIGEADCFVDIDLEHCIMTMFAGETSCFCMRYTNKDGTKFKKIVCRVFLMSIVEGDIPLWRWDHLLSHASNKKEKGVELVHQNRIADAFRKFSQGCKYIIAINLEDVPEKHLSSIVDLKVKLMNNLAHCQLHFHEYTATVSLCNKILTYDSDNAKALFRKGSACMALNEWEAALDDMTKVVEANPQDLKACKNLAICKDKVMKMNNSYKDTIKKMFV